MTTHPASAFAIALVTLLLAPSALGATPPVAVSPGDASRPALVEDRCPTFSWTTSPRSAALELLIYALEPGGELSPRPAIRRALPASATSWTPTLDSCLERGRRYAWLVRTLDEERSPDRWSAPLLIEVMAEPSADELARALEVVQRYLASRRATTAAPGATPMAAAVAAVPAAPPAAAPQVPAARAPAPLAPAAPIGLFAEVTDTADGSTAIQGVASGATGNTLGVVGIADSPTGAGVLGFANADTGTDASGVVGEAAATSGGATGVYGRTFSPAGVGVRAANFAGGIDLLLDGAAPTALTEAGIQVGGSTFEIGNAGDDLQVTIDGKPVVATTTTCGPFDFVMWNGSNWECRCIDNTTCYTGPPSTAFVGICKPGSTGCPGIWSGSPCYGEVTPEPEAGFCDFLDNDCDNTVDNDCTHCDLFTQTDCPSGQACYFDYNSQETGCIVALGGGPGSSCTSASSCAPGLACSPFTLKCTPWCDYATYPDANDPDHCAEGDVCVLFAAGVGLCSAP